MADKCEVCEEKIVMNDTGKINGTIIKVKNKEGKNVKKYLCGKCQKEGRGIDT